MFRTSKQLQSLKLIVYTKDFFATLPTSSFAFTISEIDLKSQLINWFVFLKFFKLNSHYL